MSRFYLVDYTPTSVDHSLVGDLDVVMMGGDLHLLATTHYDGTLTRWSVTSDEMILESAVAFDGGIRAGAVGSTTVVEVDAGSYALTGGAADGGLQLFDLDQADLAQAGATLGSAAAPVAGLQATQVVDLAGGAQAIFGAVAGTDGLGCLVLNAAGDVVSTHQTGDTDSSFAAGITDTTAVTIGTHDYVVAASGTENGLTVWQVGAAGALTQTDAMGTQDGLWVAAPSVVETAVVDGQAYVILGAAGSGTLTVMSVDASGALAITDHIMDDLNSRFDGVAALNVVEHHGQTYVIAGGADDGLSVFLMQADGTLQSRGHIADTTQMGLTNVSAITAVSAGNGIDIFVASSQEAGITRLHFDTGPQGVTLEAGAAGDTLSGTSGFDVITGGAGDDLLSGGAGDDIMTDGLGVDRLTGGRGADTFVFAYDSTVDYVADFEVGVDQIDLSGWPQLRSLSQLEFTTRYDGIRIRYGDDELIVLSADGQPIDAAMFTQSDLLGTAHIPQNIVAGFSGPAQDIPELPTRPDYTPHVYTAPAGDPNPESTVTIPTDDRADMVDPTGLVTGSGTAEVLSATGGNTQVYGMGGDDRIFGSSADDDLYGGSGSDWVAGRAGDDQIWGGSGHDTLLGKKGDDQIEGGGGRDLIKGHSGGDTLMGNGGGDRVRGGGGNDALDGGSGSDRMWGGGGADTMLGGNGHDTLRGGRGSDTLIGGGKNDTLIGGSGGDTLNGGKGRDVMTGGAGADTFVFADGRDEITDFNVRVDQLELNDKNWRGDLDAQDIIDRYASVQDGSVVFDFGGGDALTLTDVNTLAGLAETIDIF